MPCSQHHLDDEVLNCAQVVVAHGDRRRRDFVPGEVRELELLAVAADGRAHGPAAGLLQRPTRGA